MYYSLIEMAETPPNPRIASTFLILLSLLLTLYGAGRGGRTPTTLRSADFESAASASSAIPALNPLAQQRLAGASLSAVFIKHHSITES